MITRHGQTAGTDPGSWRGLGGPRAPAGLRPERRRGPRVSAPGTRLVGAAALCGERIVARDGEAIGHVGELLLDVQRGRIAYAVVAQGGFMGLGERLHAIPWGALRVDAERQCLALDADRATFLAAPDFDREHWPSEPGADWHHRLHRHYGCRPYWE